MAPSKQKPAYVIVGATGGIGSATASRLAASGAQLALVARSKEALERLAGETGAIALPADTSDFEAAGRVLRQAAEYYGRIDGVAHCVGSLLLKPAHRTSAEEWDDTIRQNLTSAFAVVRAAVEHMRSGGGSIVLFSSAAARTGLANHEAIAAAKAGISGLGISAAATYASRRIRVNVLAPGLVRTPLTERITGSEAALKASTALHPLGRIGEPDDVAAAIEWLLGPQSSWVTGQVIGVDGGLAALKG